MWARKCGAPPGWPSRVKVIFFSFFSGTLGLSIYMYMAGSNISYLNLEAPTQEKVLCLVDWPLRKHAITWSTPEDWLTTFFDPGGPEAYQKAREKRCNADVLSTTQCTDVVIPVVQMKRPLALPMGTNLDQSDTYDLLGIWARFFLLLTAAIWCGVTIHDLALIGRRKKHFILDVTGINEHCPSIRAVWRALAGVRVLSRLVTQRSLRLRIMGICLAILCAPVVLAWNLVLFNFFIVPLLLLAFVRYPIRMSRAWVFIVCLSCFIYGIGLTLQQVAFVIDSPRRPRYAVTWRPAEPMELISDSNITQTLHCTCGCDYPVSFSVCVNLLIIGLLTTLKSGLLAFRCLKGLRRSQWANLLSVMFPVPITIYEVDWKQPSGEPIHRRTHDMPVQGEVAFDPFALMDEQPDSALNSIHLKPEPVHRYTYNSLSGELELVNPGRHVETPSVPMPAFCAAEMHVKKAEYIGCCGFPWPTGGTQCVYEPEFIAQLERGASGDGANDSETTAENESGSSARSRLRARARRGDPTVTPVAPGGGCASPRTPRDVHVTIDVGTPERDLEASLEGKGLQDDLRGPAVVGRRGPPSPVRNRGGGASSRPALAAQARSRGGVAGPSPDQSPN